MTCVFRVNNQSVQISSTKLQKFNAQLLYLAISLHFKVTLYKFQYSVILCSDKLLNLEESKKQTSNYNNFQSSNPPLIIINSHQLHIYGGLLRLVLSCKNYTFHNKIIYPVPFTSAKFLAFDPDAGSLS